MSDGGHHHHDDNHHQHHHSGVAANLSAGDYDPIHRLLRIAVNLARRGRGGRLHDCCGNYGEPGC